MVEDMKSLRRIVFTALLLVVASGWGLSELEAVKLPDLRLPGIELAKRDLSGEAKTTGCRRTKKVVEIGLSSTKYPNVLAHIRRAVKEGWPEVAQINRVGAEERRERLLRDIPTRPGYDRDEWPPAMGRGKGKGLERGSHPTGWRAHVEYVPSAENRSAGAVMGTKLRQYCDGVRFRVVGY